ncbi:hypothetical protein H0H93_010743 [Arthromyces matolae]|nr:hypothetical protein H0H93_010743 [Arthromyces matolae]
MMLPMPSPQGNSNIGGYAPPLQSGFSGGSSFSSQQGFLPSEHINLHSSGADPNSPAAFQQSLQLVQERVARLQNLARTILAGIQNSYHPGNSMAHTQGKENRKPFSIVSLMMPSSANVESLRQEIEGLSQLMLQSGVGALPVLPRPSAGQDMPPPTEQQLLTEVNHSIRYVFEQVKRNQDSAAVVANLLSAPDRPPNPTISIKGFALPSKTSSQSSKMILQTSLFLVALVPALLVSAAGAPGDRWNPIHPNGDTSMCLDVRGGIFADGTPVQIYECNGSAAQMWNINNGTTIVQTHINGKYCLDAGSDPANGVGMKIWTCYDGLPAQTWYYTDDKRIALQGKGLCLDLPNGVHANSSQVQTWTCTDNNTNQVWTLYEN